MVRFRRLIPFLFLLYVVAYLDRVNVGFASLDMNKDLGFSAAVYGFGSGIFFLSYTLLEIPSNLILARVGARLWIARIMVSWGLVSIAMVFVNNATTFYVLRFLLGACEAGFFPGLILYLTRWFTAGERARAVAFFMTATAMAGVIGAPISSALLQLHGAWGIKGWQWLFIIEGLPAIVLAPVVLKVMTERPEDATWLAESDKRELIAALAAEQQDTSGAHVTFGSAAASGVLWAISIVYFLDVVAFYGVTFWLPTILQAAGTLPSATIVLLTAIPYMGGAIGMVIIGRNADRTGQHRWHVAAACAIGAFGFVLTILAPSSVAISLATLSIAAFGIWGALGPLWAFATSLLRGSAAAGGIALVNSIGNIGGFVGPYAVGWVRDATGAFAGGLWLLAGALVVAVAITSTIRSTPR